MSGPVCRPGPAGLFLNIPLLTWSQRAARSPFHSYIHPASIRGDLLRCRRVITGPAGPFVLALGIGIASVLGGRSVLEDGLGWWAWPFRADYRGNAPGVFLVDRSGHFSRARPGKQSRRSGLSLAGATSFFGPIFKLPASSSGTRLRVW